MWSFNQHKYLFYSSNICQQLKAIILQLQKQNTLHVLTFGVNMYHNR